MPTYGFDETVTETEWSLALAPATARGVVYGYDDWRVSPVSGLPRVTIAKGTGSAAGVVHTTTAASTLDLPKPASGGRWYCVVATYDFTRKVVEFRAIGHNTTGDSSANLAPALMPASLRAKPGEYWDQPLAFVWVHSGSKGLEAVSLRMNREGAPAGAFVFGLWERGGNAQDNLLGNFNTDTATIANAAFTSFPRGDIRFHVTAILRSTSAQGAAGRVRIQANGNTQNKDANYLYKNDWDQYTYTGVYRHPGGTFTVSAYSSTTNGQVARDGTQIDVQWFPSGAIPE